MAQHRLIYGALVEAVRAADGEPYAWTVKERASVERLAGPGVDAVATGDPRLFYAPAAGLRASAAHGVGH